MKKVFKIVFLIMMLLIVASCKKINEKKEEVKELPFYECSRPLTRYTENEIDNEDITPNNEEQNNAQDENPVTENYVVSKVYYDNDRVIEVGFETKIKYFSEDLYKNVINEEEFMKDKTANEEDLAIQYAEGEKTDLTHAPDGNEQTVNLDEYLTNLRKIGYKCDK